MIKFLYIKKQKKSILLYNKQQRGFILIELMVVVLILGLITLGLVTFFTGGTKSWVAGQSQLEAQRNARQAMDRMVREVREAKLVESSSGENNIEVSFPDSFAKSNVTYSWSGTPGDPVYRDSNSLINNVKNLTFTYPDVSKVHILLEVDVDDDGNPDITLNTDVSLRNYVL
ncbi:MAG: prepilin-type N-terminal cleavage/methylation domain-containing protein [Candidatus Atribacteria bacterium]|nr:prepilin-type N-terminal cleavage/methylation domain-containing protein [Candidatus Atribacteria bacterium]